MSSVIATVRYSPHLESEVAQIERVLNRITGLREHLPVRWLAIQLLEGDGSVLDHIVSPEVDIDDSERETIAHAVNTSNHRLQARYGADADLAVTDERYSYVHNIVEQVLVSPSHDLSPSDRIDRIVTNRWLGIPIFLVLMYFVFSLVQNVSAPYLDWVDGVVTGPITGWSVAVLAAGSAPEWLSSLVTDGIIAGVGAVLVFLPGLIVMYLSLAILEDTGYLSRAAFVMDRSMSKIGLHGRSFVPMILGFGCNVPAIYATRSIESRSARLLTGMLVPFMSCSARLPVYVIFGLALFPAHGSWVIMAMYLLGILVAAVVGLILSKTIFRDAPAGILMMEMPPYRAPSPKRVANYAWNESSAFVRRAGSIILVGTIIFWLLLNLPLGTTKMQESWFGVASTKIAPVLEPAGFGNWEASGALVTGILAKEIVVSTMSQIYVGAENGEPGDGSVTPGLLEGLREIVGGFIVATVDAGKQLIETFTPGVTIFPQGDGNQDTMLTTALQQAFTPLSALAFLVFVLLYVPCLATIGAQIHEFGWRWAALSFGIMLVIPWLLAVAVYQGGMLLGFS